MSASAILRFPLLAVFATVLLGGCSDGTDSDPVGATDTATPPVAESVPAPSSGGSIAGPAIAADALARAVDSESLPYADVDEQLVYGYFAFPTDMVEPLPAVILIHDLWGANEDIREAADRLAAEGFMVLAIDLYAGRTVTEFDDARKMTIGVVENPQEVEDNLRQAIEFVTVAGAPSVGTVGWGFGGRWALNAALLFPKDVDAAVVYYGLLPSDSESLATLEAPLLGLFGERDRAVTIESVRGFEQAMNELSLPVEIEVYPDVGHAFADPFRKANYDVRLAQDAWQRMSAFLAANLPVKDDGN